MIRSDPGGGTTATRGSTVVLTVSKGQKLAKVPVLVGTQRSVAVQQIRGRGLTPERRRRRKRQAGGRGDPPGAERRLRSCRAGSTVSIVVSKGEEKTKVPNVIGKERRRSGGSAARSRASTRSVRNRKPKSPTQVGRVTDQFPPPGSEVEPGSEVTVVVGKRAPKESEAEARMRVAVLCGGRSSEHDVSLRSGEAVARGLEQAGHEALR